jgi:replicative DNA helicase
LGCIFNNAYLLDAKDKYALSTEDFPDIFHKIIFGSLYAIHELGAKEITLLNIDDFLKSRPKSKGTFDQYKGDEWLTKAAEVSSISTFDYYYARLKKMTLLRAYNEIGVNVNDIYDPDNLLDAKKM